MGLGSGRKKEAYVDWMINLKYPQQPRVSPATIHVVHYRDKGLRTLPDNRKLWLAIAQMKNLKEKT